MSLALDIKTPLSTGETKVAAAGPNIYKAIFVLVGLYFSIKSQHNALSASPILNHKITEFFLIFGQKWQYVAKISVKNNDPVSF